MHYSAFNPLPLPQKSYQYRIESSIKDAIKWWKSNQFSSRFLRCRTANFTKALLILQLLSNAAGRLAVWQRRGWRQHFNVKRSTVWGSERRVVCETTTTTTMQPEHWTGRQPRNTTAKKFVSPNSSIPPPSRLLYILTEGKKKEAEKRGEKREREEKKSRVKWQVRPVWLGPSSLTGDGKTLSLSFVDQQQPRPAAPAD